MSNQDDDYTPYAKTIPSYLNQRWWVDQGRDKAEGKLLLLPKRYIRFTEARKDNILKYEEAIDAVDIVSAALYTFADISIAYGYSFYYDHDEELEDRFKERIKFLKLWNRFVKFPIIQKYMILCGLGLGDAIVEKVYDEQSYDEGGWGIKALKLVHPATVEVERDQYGRPKSYVQDITKTEHLSGSYFIPRQQVTSGRTRSKTERDEWQTTVPAEHIIHYKPRAFTNGPYGRSVMRAIKTGINIILGLENDHADIARTMARPLTVWYMGDAENPMPRKHMEAIATSISQGLSAGNDIAIDGRVKAEVIGAGNAVMDIMPFYEQEIRKICAALGVPASLLGLVPSGSGQSLEIEEEYFRRRVMAAQKEVGLLFETEVFRDIFLFHPSDLATAKGRKMTQSITPKQFAEIPQIRYHNIENTANMRLRVREEIITGVMTIAEGRVEFGRPEFYDEEDLHPDLVQSLAQANNLNKATENMDRELDIAEKQAENQIETAKISADAAKSRATNTNSGSIKTSKTKASK